jgi:WD40 repeat protein
MRKFDITKNGLERVILGGRKTSKMAATGGGSLVSIVEVLTGGFNIPEYPQKIIVHPSKPMILSDNRKAVRVWDQNTGVCIKTLGVVRSEAIEEEEDEEYWDAPIFTCLTLCPEGKCLAVGTFDGKVKLWDLDSGDCFLTYEYHTAHSIYDIKWDCSGTLVAFGLSDGNICVLDTKSGVIRYTNTQSSEVLGLVAHPSDDLLASRVHRDYTVSVRRFSTGEHIHTLEGHSAKVTSLATTASWLITSADDQTVRVWSWSTGECVRVFDFGDGHGGGFFPQRLVCSHSTLIISCRFAKYCGYTKEFIYDISPNNPMEWHEITNYTLNGVSSIDYLGNIINVSYIGVGSRITMHDFGMKRQQTRTKVIKEELIRKAWHPDRICKWIEEGYDPSDF